ncbi:hybrid sensor histidine kinase/response regulator [Bacteroides fragilis]|uniref:ATP-binding response regulator n=1 Tax=Bacteroides fragilis TaxID=817 RepID=UPI0004AC8619|nr:hybrid sensor histidine kinase/response regulator [Bacteroides fragilis]MCE9336804.1 hybrid sensor histidine kinase/response regulator [Bacteroides fragilis]
MKKNNENGTLQMKILAGYLLLILLVGGVITTAWYEQRMFRRAEREERAMLEQRRLSNAAFKSLATLFLDSERALLWDSGDLTVYRKKGERVAICLDELRRVYPDPVQRARIDTVQLLLEEKKRQGEQLVGQIRRLVCTETGSPQGEPSLLKGRGAHIAGISDSLRIRNHTLNRNINRMVNNLEDETMRRTTERQEAVSRLRGRALCVMLHLSGACIVCVVLLYVLINRDIKRKHRYRLRLEAAGRHSRDLLAQRKKIMLTLAHDIRGPLNTINGSAELAAGIRDKRKRDSHLQNIRHSCGHILRLVNDLLDVYRLNEGKDTPNLVPFRLDSLLERIAGEYGNLAHHKGLLFDARAQGTGVTVKGDADRIEQIADNLLSNAVKFTPAGRVEFAVSHGKGGLRMVVSDTGIGMAQADIKRVFQPFERAAQHIDTEGFGLGLPITRSLVKLLGGSIRVESEPGRGSRFTVCLPLETTNEAVTRQEVTSASALPAHLRIAAIDDDPMQLRIVREMLERNGAHCDTCTHVRELMEKIRQTDYDLLLTDIQMRDTGGFDLLRLLRSARIGNSREVPVLAMTARGDTRREVLARTGFAGCIYKPFSMTELLQAVGSHVARKDRDTDRGEGLADLSRLTADVSNPEEVLDTFIEECRRNRHGLEELARTGDTAGMERMVHRLLPLWEMLGVEIPLAELGIVLRAGGTEEKTDEAASRVLEYMDTLAAQAERLKGGTENEGNTDC